MAAKPRYLQLKELIINQISTGELKPRDRVPSENDLVGATGVSRMTANRALRELTNEGYVKRVAGVGTFVVDVMAASHVLEVKDIADEIHERGHSHSSIVLHQGQVVATEQISEALHCGTGEPVFHVVVVHHENGVPIQLEDRFASAAFAPDFLQQDFSKITPSAYLSAISPLQEAEHVVRAAMPDGQVREHLQIGDAEPCLIVIRRTWAQGVPVTFTRLYHPANKYQLAGHYAPPGTPKSSSADTLVLRNFNR
jgi:GntR family histidine utilization transcriptional repressor